MYITIDIFIGSSRVSTTFVGHRGSLQDLGAHLGYQHMDLGFFRQKVLLCPYPKEAEQGEHGQSLPKLRVILHPAHVAQPV